ncbi:hypothetical protein SD70_30115, partial [Gordoniibacillus kamchatkensis]
MLCTREPNCTAGPLQGLDPLRPAATWQNLSLPVPAVSRLSRRAVRPAASRLRLDPLLSAAAQLNLSLAVPEV